MQIADTHAHLDQEEFTQDQPAVLERARQAGINKILAVGVTAASSRAVLDIARCNNEVFAAVGIHPNYAVHANPDDWQEITSLCGNEKVKALGETGLDQHWDFTPWQTQIEYFQRHLALSRETKLPLVIHTRDCEHEMLEQLRADFALGPLLGVMHSFTGNVAMAQECIAMGLYISFAGMLTYKKSVELRAAAAALPANRLLVETDSPYLSPHPKRGERNEPAHVAITLRALAEARGESIEAMAAITSENARNLFGW